MSDNNLLFARLINAPLWERAEWSGTAFQFHPTGECPPVLGIAFENGEAGREIFSDWVAILGNQDPYGEIRVSIIEGDLPDKQPGYIVHISPDPVAAVKRAEAEGITLDPNFFWFGRVDRMYPSPESASLLPKFKEQYKKHKEYLLAPVTRRADGKQWADIEFGLVKTTIHFRDISEITEDDLDAFVLQIPSQE